MSDSKKNRSFLDRLLILISPILLIDSPKHLKMWYQEEKEKYRTIIKNVMPWVALAYFAHFLLVDNTAKGNYHSWLYYRFIPFFFSIAIWLHARSVMLFKRTKYFKLPLIILSIVVSVTQTLCLTELDHRIPVFFSYLLPVIGVWVLHYPALLSAIMLSMLLTPVSILLLKFYNYEFYYIQLVVSADILSVITIILLRSTFSREIELFNINNKYNDDMNAQISQKQDLVEQIKSFVPKEIFNRIIELHEKTRVSFAYAVDEVLRARAKHVVCLYSDIRGFTEGSRDPIFLRQLALPNIKKITKLVDSYRGVPRLVGDLVLAYFDFEEPTRNAELALKCAIEICKDSYGKVDTTSTELNRYILLTAGIAMVGNIGATDGSREITCLGSPMNLLQRIDEITKSQKLKNSVPPFSIIITADILTYIDSLDDLPFAFRELNLKELDISIRNFSEITKLYFITPSEVVHFKKAA